jgi:excisionase family DNA binding protein
MSGDLMTVKDAAVLLGVSRRRAEALVQSGALPAERVGARWIVSGAKLRQAEHNLWREAGRPMSQRSAWRIIRQGLTTDPLGGPALDRTRRRLRSRAKHVSVFVHPSQLHRVCESPDVILGGRTAAQVAGAPIDVSDKFDAYIRDSKVDALIRDNAARLVSDGENLNLHVIEDSVWPFDPEQRYANAWIAWLDLADSGDRAADTLLDRIASGSLNVDATTSPRWREPRVLRQMARRDATPNHRPVLQR